MAQTLSEGPVIPDIGGDEQIDPTGVGPTRVLGTSTNAALASVRVGADEGIAQASAKAVVAEQIASAADSTSRERDVVLEGLIAGMEGMTYVGAWESGATYRINDVVTHGGDSWARLTTGSAGEPGASPADWGLVARKGDGGGFGELAETPTVGLYETVDNGIESRVAVLERDTGTRRIEAAIPGYISGEVTLRRVGKIVMLGVNELAATPASGTTVSLPASFVPPGFRFFPPTYAYYASFARSSSHNIGSLRISRYGQVDFYNMNGLRSNVIATWVTDEAWPSTLPGTPA